MTDLVAQLVGALEGLTAMYAKTWDVVDGGLAMLSDSVKEFEKAHEEARAALSAAKDGGWVAVQNKPVAYGIATERGAMHSVKTNLVSANKCAEKWRQKQAENGFADWRCHVVPLAPLPNPPKDQS